MIARAESRADLILTGGVVFTGNPRQARAEALAVRGNRIVAVGSAAGLAPLSGKGTRVVDLAGRFACAGFNDAHTHMLMGGLARSHADLRGAPSRREFIDRLRAVEAALPAGAWLRGFGWDQGALGEWPHRDWLDEAFPARPVWLMRIDTHTGLASTAALSAAGLGEQSADPDGGELVRSAGGRLTGILKERAAERVHAAVPEPTVAERRGALEAVLKELRAWGVTSVHDLSGSAALETLEELRVEGRLTVRVSAWTPLGTDLAEAIALRERFPAGDPVLRCATLKGFVDGTLGAATAALIEPYADGSGSRGEFQWDEPTLAALVRRGHQAGFQITLHAIGDAALRRALGAFDGLGAGARTRRHRIEHVEVAAPGDLPRMARLGLIASMQPSQLISDQALLASRLGPARLARCFPWRELFDQGVLVVFGTDWPVEPFSPMRTLRGAVAPPQDGAAGHWRAGRNLTLWEALSAMTLWPAHASFEEEIKGTLQAGRLADIVVLSGDPFAVEPDTLESLSVDLTVFDGRIVFARENGAAA